MNDTVRAFTVQPGDTAATEATVPVRQWLEAMQGLVGGYVQTVPSEDGRVTFWCDEDGKNRGLPVNELATAYWWLVCPAAINADVLCGPVVITGGVSDRDGTLPVPDDVARLITETYMEDDQG